MKHDPKFPDHSDYNQLARILDRLPPDQQCGFFIDIEEGVRKVYFDCDEYGDSCVCFTFDERTGDLKALMGIEG